MKISLCFFMFLLLTSSQSFSQHYAVLGSGGTISFYSSDELDSFKQTYNSVNAPNLNELLGGFDTFEGLRFEGGYRYIGNKLATSLLVGWERLTSKNNARYNNGDNRTFRLTNDAIYLEGGAGPAMRDFFVTGAFSLFFNRQLRLRSAYSNLSGSEYVQRLDGTYTAQSSLSGDLGLAVGVRRGFMIVVAKISHAVFTSNSPEPIRDTAREKVANGSDIFPEDYIKFYNQESYEGVPNKLEGWKLSLSFAFALVLKR